MSEVDLSQSSNDFAQQATNPADSNEQPTGSEPAGAKPTEEKPTEQPKEGETPPAKTEDVTPPETKTDEPTQPADFPQGEQPTEETDAEKERKNAAQKITELGEERAKLFKTYLGLVEDNPDVIKDIHKRDSGLANAIIKEHWGYENYEELSAYARVKDLEDSDPERAKSEKELLDLKKSNRTILSQLREGAEETFYKNKGITKNPFDSKYQAIQEALTKVNPTIVETNYSQALELAHQLAFPGRTEEQIKEDQKKITLATNTGTPISKGKGTSPRTPTKHTAEQQGFMQNVGVTPQ